MELTKDQLKQLLPKNPYIDQWFNALSQLLPDYEINTPQRIASFLAQCAHESGEFGLIPRYSQPGFEAHPIRGSARTSAPRCRDRSLPGSWC